MVDYMSVKQVSRIEYVGPCQIQTTTVSSVNYSARIKDCKKKQPTSLPEIIEYKTLKVE